MKLQKYVSGITLNYISRERVVRLTFDNKYKNCVFACFCNIYNDLSIK